MIRSARTVLRRHAAALVLVALAAGTAGAEIAVREAKDTLTAVELDRGDALQFRLAGGRVVAIRLEATEAAIVERVTPGGIVYRFEARLRVDGLPVTLQRYVCSQECFYEPYVINGVRIWLDTVNDVFDLVPIRYPREGNLQCRPRKRARLAIQDATLRICPQPMHPWIDDERDVLDVGACYNGDDCYLGPYLGQACHVGMDINHPKGSVLFAPIDFDAQAYFNSLALGHNNNRWRGIRRWPNGDVWALQTHHLIELLVPENAPLEAGTRYATTAGVHVGSHEHTHFEFKIGRPREPAPGVRPEQPASSIAVPIDFDDESPLAQAHPEVLHLDPWIVFWQIFEDRKARRGALRAAMEPLAPARTGEAVSFSSAGSTLPGTGRVEFFWTFGDGGSARGPAATHAFAREGVYPVTLVIDDGVERSSTTQHVTVGGEAVREPVLALTAPDEPSFRRRPARVTDVYGASAPVMPCTLRFLARALRPAPDPKTVGLENQGGGTLEAASAEIAFEGESGWLDLTHRGQGNAQSLVAAVDATGLAEGTYRASVEITCPGAMNGSQWFRVELHVSGEPPSAEVIVDDRDAGFYATPYFWVGHRFCRCPADRRGHAGFYLTNGARPAPGEWVRFTPDLRAGRYEVALHEATPFGPDVEFGVRVRHARGHRVVPMRPTASRVIGAFEFDEGTDGFVEILAEGSRGLVIADAVCFRPKAP